MEEDAPVKMIARPGSVGRWISASVLVCALGCSPAVDGAGGSTADVSTGPVAAPEGAGNSDEEIVYGLGLMMAESLSMLALSPRERLMFEQALRDQREGTVRKPLGEVLADLPKFQQVRLAKARELEAAAGEAFLTKAKAEESARELESGTVAVELEAGSGDLPELDGQDAVVVNFEVRLRNGTVVDSSQSKGGPQTYAFSGTMGCWQDVLPEMKVGAKLKLTCPPNRAYGAVGQLPLIPSSATVEADLELVGVIENGAAMHGGSQFRRFNGAMH